jgi:CRP/FNR family transcriptional regulator, cyclic AMP receptor protein
MHDDVLKRIRRSPYFAALTSFDLRWTLANMTFIDTAPGGLLIEEGGYSPGLLVILEGTVKVVKSAPDGREQVLRIVRPCDSLNDVPAFDGGPSPATAVAIEPSRIACLAAPVFRELLHRNSAVMVQLLQTYVSRLRSVTALAGDLTLLDVTSRVAKALDVYTQTSGSDQFELRQDQLAGIVGTKRETVARALRLLEDRGAIERRRDSIAIRSRPKLRKAAANPLPSPAD